MAVQLTNVKASREYGSNIDDHPFNQSAQETNPDVPTYEPPRWSRGDGSVNAAFDIDSYESIQSNEKKEIKPVGKNPGGMGLQRVVNVDKLRASDIGQQDVSEGDDAQGSSSRSSLSSRSKSISDSDSEEHGWWGRTIPKVQGSVSSFFHTYGEPIKHSIYAIFILAYAGYFAWCLNYEFGTESSIRLLWMTMLAVVLIIITLVRDNFGDQIYEHVIEPPVAFVKRHFTIFKWCFIACVLAGWVIFIIIDVGLDKPGNLISLAGLVVYVLLMFIFSKYPAKVRWRPVFWGLGLQFVFALIVIRTTWGYEAFKWLGDRIQEFILYSDEGAKFVFGDNFEEHFFAFKVLPIVIFFSSVISVLYHFGVMQSIIVKISWVMQRTLGTTAAESMNAVGNIFFAQQEAPMLIRPMIKDMTKSELHAVIVGGYATIAGSVMATYISIGVSAVHLISASIMAAPCALAISKLFYPETEKSKTDVKNVSIMQKSEYRTVVEAASAGASIAIPQVANIAVNLMAFISLLAFVNTTLTWMGHRAGLWPPDYPELTFELICSYVLWPFAWLMGAEKVDCNKVAELIGIKLFLNEFVAYTELGVIISNSQYFSTYNGTVQYYNDDMYLVDDNITLYGGVMQPRSIAISTYALCGFANIGSLGIAIGALGGIAPERKPEIAALALRALVAGTVVSLINACVAGLLYDEGIM